MIGQMDNAAVYRKVVHYARYDAFSSKSDMEKLAFWFALPADDPPS